MGGNSSATGALWPGLTAILHTMAEKRDFMTEGQRSFEGWRDNFLANPENRRIYEEEAAKKELWLQLVEARQAAGMMQ